MKFKLKDGKILIVMWPAIKKNCESIDLNCRRKQRQAILQWTYNPFI